MQGMLIRFIQLLGCRVLTSYPPQHEGLLPQDSTKPLNREFATTTNTRRPIDVACRTAIQRGTTKSTTTARRSSCRFVAERWHKAIELLDGIASSPRRRPTSLPLAPCSPDGDSLRDDETSHRTRRRRAGGFWKVHGSAGVVFFLLNKVRQPGLFDHEAVEYSLIVVRSPQVTTLRGR